jgi:cobalt-zinc-cadmium efflux system membrane fusion protein
VHCHFEKYDKRLIPGMYMNALIELKNKTVYALPENAVVSYNGKDYVFLAINKNTFKMKAVETGIRQNSYVEILNYQDIEGSPVVTENAYTLLMSLKNKSEE